MTSHPKDDIDNQCYNRTRYSVVFQLKHRSKRDHRIVDSLEFDVFGFAIRLRR
jgi:hypothetical protein